MTLAASSAGPSALWYLTRGTGLVALVLLTASVVLGVFSHSRWERPRWPRFATIGLHRNVSLLVVAVLGVHIITAEIDTFAPVGWLAVVVPFASTYRPVWLGLGTLAFDLLIAVVITSLLRARLGLRAWRLVHWLAYLAWPVAVVHGLGTGSDTHLHLVTTLDFVCVTLVVLVIGWRLAHGWPSRATERLVAGSAAVAAVVGLYAWASTGPLRAGWAKRAGTPSNLLAASTAGSSQAGATTSAPNSGGGNATATGRAVPALPFSATISGTLTDTGPDSHDQVTVTITAHVSGPMTGDLSMVLRGRAYGTGVSLSSSSVTFGPSSAPQAYQGQVVALDGDQLVADVSASTGAQIELGVSLQTDPASNSLQGILDARTR